MCQRSIYVQKHIQYITETSKFLYVQGEVRKLKTSRVECGNLIGTLQETQKAWAKGT